MQRRRRPDAEELSIEVLFEAVVLTRANIQKGMLQELHISVVESPDALVKAQKSISLAHSPLDRFAGYADVKKALRRAIHFHFSSEKSLSSKLGATTRGIVLHGASGCGKTFLAGLLAEEMKMSCLAIRSTQLLSKYFGETEKQIREIFKAARASAPSLLFFDDFDVLAIRRRGRGGKNKSDDAGDEESEDEAGEGISPDLQARVLSTFLNELDGVQSTSQWAAEATVVVVACKSLSLLDEALLRPGRLHLHIHLERPSLQTVAEMLPLLLSEVPCAVDLSVDMLAEAIHALEPTCAMVKRICSHAVMAAIAEAIAVEEDSTARRRREEGEECGYPPLSDRHFAASLKAMGVRGDPLDQALQALRIVDG